MKKAIEIKLEEHGKKILDKEELCMDDVNFLIFWMNRLECKEAQRLNEEKEEKLREQREESNKVLMKSMQDIFGSMPK